MIKEFASTREYLEETKDGKQTQTKFKNMLKILASHVNQYSKVLDVGERNPMTELIEKEFMLGVDSTKGDLDEGFHIPSKGYNVIIFSHVIEHIFNPLYCLLRLRKVLARDGVIIVALPQRTPFLWTEGHYHEIDDYRIRLLFKRAGLKVIKKYKRKVYRERWHLLKGLRPMLRFLFEYNAIYIVRKP